MGRCSSSPAITARTSSAHSTPSWYAAALKGFSDAPCPPQVERGKVKLLSQTAQLLRPSPVPLRNPMQKKEARRSSLSRLDNVKPHPTATLNRVLFHEVSIRLEPPEIRCETSTPIRLYQGSSLCEHPPQKGHLRGGNLSHSLNSGIKTKSRLGDKYVLVKRKRLEKHHREGGA